MEKREKKVTFSQFQKLGKVLMTPVMILPIAGILVGIGSAFTTKNIVALWPVLGNTYVKLFFNLLKAMGNTINSYLPIIFAVSVAIGYAEKEKGIAALSSVIGFLAMNNVMNILLTSLGILDPAAMKTGQSMVMGIASLDTGVFGGILVGLLVAKLHNKYYNIQAAAGSGHLLRHKIRADDLAAGLLCAGSGNVCGVALRSDRSGLHGRDHL